MRLIYFCSFVPYLALGHLGLEMVSAYDADISNAYQSNLGGNLCSFVKSCEKINFSEFDGVIFTNCCNSAQRLYDYVTYHYPRMFSFLLEISRTENVLINHTDLIHSLKRDFFISAKKDADAFIETAPVYYDILILGSSLHKGYVNNLKQLFDRYQLNFETCHSTPRGDLIINGTGEVSCPRMMHYLEYCEHKILNAKAVICIATQKCDHILFAFPQIKELCRKYDKKCLLLEEEYVGKISENSKLRYEAFKECLMLDKK